jgi:thioredoxin-like negative regulator of GroEL
MIIKKFDSLFCVITLLSIFLGSTSILLAKDSKQSPALIRVSTPVYRPRVLYFYANWCGTCRKFGPSLRQIVGAYRNYVDFQPIDVDNPSSRSLTQRFGIHSIPATYIFNSKGQKVFEKVGIVDQQSLYNVLKSVYMESVSQTINKDTAKNRWQTKGQ